ncbi:MAG: oligosaccharide flippase family protein, partial [Alphaproteobacteria bacterium]|nr:oligosaccharide flippase family protein [Alphaproteobacteria bacterium]
MANSSGGIIEKPHPETKSHFKKNVLTLMAGTSVAQALPIAISPILTRIYTPEDFGLFAIYMALASIISIIVTGRYELAIMLPHKDEDGFQIMVFAMFITLILSLSLLLLVNIFNFEFASAIQHPEIAPYLYFLPFSVLITGLYQTLNFWHNRNKRYTNIAINRVVQNSGTASGQLCFPLVNQSFGLIAGQIFGQFLGLIYFVKSYGSKDHTNYRVNVLKMRALAIK